MHDLSILKKCPLFYEKTLDHILDLLSTFQYRIVTYSKDETIFAPFMTPDSLGILLSGTLDVLKHYPSGKSLLITRKTPSSLLGEETLFSRLNEYPEHFIATTTCKILFIKKDSLEALLEDDEQINKNFIYALSEAAITVKKCYGVLTLNTIQEKIAGYLYHEHLRNHSLKIILPFSKKMWAEHLNLSRTSLSRELREMVSNKIIQFHGREIIIIDFEKLKNILFLS